MQLKLVGITNVDFNVIGQQLIRSSTSVRYCRKSGTIYQLFIDFNKAYDTVRREVYSILTEFGIPRKLVGLLKKCLNKTYSRVHIGKSLSDKFPIQNDLKQGDALSTLLFNLALEHAIRRVQGK
jgi:hypothetical protein